MTLSKKHFKKIAELIKLNTLYNNGEEKYINYSSFIAGLSEFFRTENKKFNLTKFMDACIN
jgi:hypothetical protein